MSGEKEWAAKTTDKFFGPAPYYSNLLRNGWVSARKARYQRESKRRQANLQTVRRAREAWVAGRLTGVAKGFDGPGRPMKRPNMDAMLYDWFTGLALGQGFRVTGPMVVAKAGALALARQQSFPEEVSPLFPNSKGKTDADLDMEKAQKWAY